MISTTLNFPSLSLDFLLLGTALFIPDRNSAEMFGTSQVGRKLHSIALNKSTRFQKGVGKFS